MRTLTKWLPITTTDLMITLLAVTVSAEPQGNLIPRKELAPLYSIQRTKVKFGGGDVLILLHKDRFTHPERLYRFLSIEAFIESSSDIGEGRGRFVCQKQSRNPWCQNGAGSNPNFNCHAYAVGDIVGLTLVDWLDGAASELTDGGNPMQVVLDNFFSLVLEFSAKPEDIKQIAMERGLQEGDVLTMFKHNSDGSIEYIHSGRVVKEGTKNWLESKLGEGPLIVAPIISYATEYAGLFDAVRLYRKKKTEMVKIGGPARTAGPKFIVLWVYYEESRQDPMSGTTTRPGWASLAVFQDKETCRRSLGNLSKLNDKPAICLPAGVELEPLAQMLRE